MTFKTGDQVRITYAGKTVLGDVTLASENGRSLMLTFDAMLGGFVGMMPVLDGRDLIERKPVTIELVERAS